MKKLSVLIFMFFASMFTFAQVNITADITSNTTWTSNNVYTLDGLIFVDSSYTLTIEPGTVIKGKLQSNITTGDGASALIVRRGGKLIADGTAQNPIIFTSELDDVNNPNDLTAQDRELWGGLILLGRAVTNQPTTENQIEGIPNTLNARFGGDDDNDNSGVLRYISVRHGGFSISGVIGDEINGVTFGAVGRGTTVEHIEVFANFDDGYEFFGGTVEAKYLVAAFCGDDAFDWDMGFRGKGQFWFAVQGTDEAGRGGELDGGDDNETGTPYAVPLLSNITWIGAGASSVGVGGDGNDRALYFRDNSGGKIWNSIVTDFVASTSVVTVEDLTSGEDSRSRLEAGELVLANNIWYGFSNGNTIGSVATQDFVQTHLLANGNQIVDPQLNGISRTPNGGLDPRPSAGSPANSGFVAPPDAFFSNVSYLGAFNPVGKPWTQGWTAVSALGFTPVIIDPVVNITADITSNTTWTSNNVYTLDGLIFVDSSYTLTIEPGTVIKGKLQSNITTGDGASALVVRRGGKLIADGTAQNPIIFTSELDDVNNPNDLTAQDRELWGGLILLGRAVTNQPTTENQIEGIPNTLNARFGGDDDNDNSGVLRYISVRHGGFSISGVIGDEINGVTFGAVGRGTTVEHIEVFANFDDGYEFFGGTVEAKYLVAAFCGDDAFDWDMGFRGKGQFWFAVQGTDEAGRGGELDGGDDNETGTPYAVPLLSNITWIGAGASSVGVGGDGNDRALYFRDNSGGKIWNSIVTDFVASTSVVTVEDLTSGEDSRSRLEAGELVLANNIWYGFSNGNTIGSIATQDFVQTHLLANGNQIVDPQLNGISRTPNGGLDPRPSAGSPANSGFVAPPDAFFSNVSYLGAFNPADGIWTEGWTAVSALGYTSYTTVDVEEEILSTTPVDYTLSQNYPNPFNPSTRIVYSVVEPAQVRITVTNILGQVVETLVDDFRNSGTYEITFNASNLSSGLYIYTLEAGSKFISKKMTLLK